MGIKTITTTQKRVKTKELALYYNLAIDRIISLLNYFEGTAEKDERFWKNKLSELKANANEGKSFNIKIETFAFLKNYLFYQKPNEKNSSITIGFDEKVLLVYLLDKLFDLRNWHSHYYHKDFPLTFQDSRSNEKINGILFNLEKFIEVHFDVAAEKCIKNDNEQRNYYRSELSKSFMLFEDHKISYEGRLFFLSFFLTKGEMNRCLSGSKGFKKTNNPQWKLKREIFTFYSKRDGSSLLAVLFKARDDKEYKDSGPVKKHLQLFNRFNEIIEYLKSKPALICTNEEIELFKNNKQEFEIEEKERIRLHNRLMSFSIQFLLDFEKEYGFKNKIEWRFRNTLSIPIEKQKIDIIFKQVSSKPYFGSSSYIGESIYINEGMAYFKFIDGNEEFLCSINEQGVLYLVASIILGYKSSESILKDISHYIKQYNSIIAKLKRAESVDLKEYNKINPFFLHKSLVNWINNDPDDNKVLEYKKQIQNKIKSKINELNQLDINSIELLKAPIKNQLLFKWYNYLSSIENKFTIVKNLFGVFSEIDNLSRFHFAPSNNEGKLRIALINDFKHKLPPYLIDALTSKKHKNIDDIIYEILPIIKEQFLYWEKLTDLELCPPEWNDTNKMSSTHLQTNSGQWSKMTLDNWHILARKLNISNPFLQSTRSNKNENRQEELAKFFETHPIQMPKQLFIDVQKITETTKNKNDERRDVKSISKQIRKHELSKGIIQDFYIIDSTTNKIPQIANTKKGMSVGKLVKEILYTQTSDTLLWGICLEYHKKLFATGKLGKNILLDYDKISVSEINEFEFNWTILGHSISIKQKQLKKMMYDFKTKEIETILRKKLNKENTAESINEVFQDNYFESLRYIQRIFELEECVLKGIIDQTKPYIGFNEVLEKIDLTKISKQEQTVLNNLRRSAFHTHIPPDTSYKEGIEIIEKFLTHKRFAFYQFKPKDES